MSLVTNASIWNLSASNYNGINPPQGKLIPVPANTYGPSFYSPIDTNIDLVYIYSRAPYAQEFLKTKYGQVENRVGTNIGR